ncbi:hypothetical protein Lfu02_14130 [Longispora fulva]|uniref:ESAT-6-like protein n=1 Tax=Longispora fulva TaxID=619741 RepID=A0A8J7KTC4_9ACTN|nr:WXG100 family type VII secretion target [Longispora fulva]MBG6140577.1 WXG100 family type VII secretion target [Longispora fulva]GIG57041.1 hypothetical protein Lfu02_14130 [Longispora fulva]
MTDGALVYDFGTIDSVSGQIETFVRDMNQTLEDTDKVFRNLLANGWSGKGAEAFTGASQRWHQQADAMAATLRRLSSSVGNAAVNMQAADQAAAGRFGH